MSPALNESSAIRRFKHSNAIKIRDGIIFDFYMGLPHISLKNGRPRGGGQEDKADSLDVIYKCRTQALSAVIE